MAGHAAKRRRKLAFPMAGAKCIETGSVEEGETAWKCSNGYTEFRARTEEPGNTC